MRSQIRRRRVAAWAVVVAAATAVRLPLISAAVPLGYDDGVYASSVKAMRDGAVPFRDVFSSQGPVFLPTLRLFDIVGLEHPWAPRLAMIAAGIAIGLAVCSIAERIVPLPAAAAFGVAATTSAAVVLASGPLEADGLALAFVAVAFAVALIQQPGRRAPIVVGTLGAFAIATKSLFALPGVLAAISVIWARRSRRDAGLAIASGLVVGLIVSVPFGLGNVWDQYVRFHLLVPQTVDPTHNATGLLTSLGRHEVVLLGLAALAALWLAVASSRRGPADRTVVRGTSIWLLTTVAVVVFGTDFNPGDHRYAAFLVVPLLALIATARIQQWLVVATLAVLLPFHIAAEVQVLNGHQLTPDESRLLAVLETIRDDSNVVSDVQPITYAANLGSPPWLVDTSYARIRAGYLTADSVVDGMSEPNTCAVVLWSGRLEQLAPDVFSVARDLGYTDRLALGPGHDVLIRPGCESLPRLPQITASNHGLEQASGVREDSRARSPL